MIIVGIPGQAAGLATGSTVVLGNIGTFNGFVGQSVTGYQQMLGVWQKWVNAHGGLNGHVVRVISENDNGDPSTALTIAKQMVEQDHILAFFDPFLLFDFDPITAYAASVNIPIVGGDGLNPAWSSTPIAFPATASLGAITNAGNEYAAKGGAKKIGVLYCVETPGHLRQVQRLDQGAGGPVRGIDRLRRQHVTHGCQLHRTVHQRPVRGRADVVGGR